MKLIKVKADEIRVNDRTRKHYGDLEGLAYSIAQVGLLQPIVVNESMELVVGERRLRAWKEYIDEPQIPAYVTDVLDDAIDLIKALSSPARANFTFTLKTASAK